MSNEHFKIVQEIMTSQTATIRLNVYILRTANLNAHMQYSFEHHIFPPNKVRLFEQPNVVLCCGMQLGHVEPRLKVWKMVYIIGWLHFK